jgi:hypothetical protein
MKNKKETLKEIVRRVISEDTGRLVGKFYFDKRKNKPFRIISIDGTDRNGNNRTNKNVDMGIQYYNFNTKKPIGDIETIDKSEFDYFTSQGQWTEFKQDFFGSI